MATTKSVLRWGGLILGAIVALALIAAGALFYLVTRLDVKAEVERAVENATGRQLTISGSVGVSFYPVLGLKAEQASLANVAGGRAPALAAMDEIDIGVELRPLLHREVVVRQLVLQHPRVALELDANGQPNWQLHPRVAPTNPPAHPAPQEGPSASPRNTMTLNEIRMVDGELSFFDARRNLGWVISDADLHSALTSLDTPLRINGDLTYNNQRLGLALEFTQPRLLISGQVGPVKLDMHTDLLTASFEGQAAGSAGQFSGVLRASGPHLRQLAAWTGTPINGGVGLEDFAVSGRIEVNGPQVAFTNAGFSVDQIRGRGDFTLSRLRNKPYLSGRLQLFDFDLNPYLNGRMPDAPADAAAPPTPAPTQTLAASTADIAVAPASDRAVDVQAPPSARAIDFSQLNAINADLDLTTAALLFQHMRLDSSQFSLVINDGFMAATLHRVSLYGGSAHGRFEIDARTPDARLAQDIIIEGVDAQRFLSDAVNFTSVEGKAELSYRASSHGRTPRELLASTDGRMHIEVVTGALRGVDLGGLSRTLSLALRGELIAPAARTPFHGFSATFALADGVLASDTLSFTTPDLTITGLGLIDLNAHTFDARLAPRSPRGGIVVPFTVTGPFTALHYNSDIRGRARAPLLARVRAVQARAH